MKETIQGFLIDLNDDDHAVDLNGVTIQEIQEFLFRPELEELKRQMCDNIFRTMEIPDNARLWMKHNKMHPRYIFAVLLFIEIMNVWAFGLKNYGLKSLSLPH